MTGYLETVIHLLFTYLAVSIILDTHTYTHTHTQTPRFLSLVLLLNEVINSLTLKL